jgi:hypothetical protein
LVLGQVETVVLLEIRQQLGHQSGAPMLKTLRGTWSGMVAGEFKCRVQNAEWAEKRFAAGNNVF